MQEFGARFSNNGLEINGILGAKNVYWNLTPPVLYEESIKRSEGWIADSGPLVVHTGKHTGRSPNDKFVVREPSSEQFVWWGKVNKPMETAQYDRLFARMVDYIKGCDLFVQDVFVGAELDNRQPIRVITEFAWSNLFSQNMFIRPKPEECTPDFRPGFTVINIPSFKADPAIDGTRSEIFIIVHFGKKQIIIGGTHYGGEIKKIDIHDYELPYAS